jgi:hypothetical protein
MLIECAAAGTVVVAGHAKNLIRVEAAEVCSNLVKVVGRVKDVLMRRPLSLVMGRAEHSRQPLDMRWQIELGRLKHLPGVVKEPGHRKQMRSGIDF